MDNMSKVLLKLNESQMVPEPTINLDDPKDFKQCPKCAGIFKGAPEFCPVCGEAIPSASALKESRAKARKLKECDDPTVIVKKKVDEDEDEDCDVIKVEEENEKLPKDVEVEVKEALDCLSDGDHKAFNESYRNSRLLKNGKLNILVESRSGRVYSVVRKINSIQRANYKLAESMTIKTARRSATNAKLESVRAARMNLAALTEMSAVKVAALRLMERQGIKVDYKKFDRALKEAIGKSADRLKKKFEDIAADKETGTASIEDSTPEEIASDVVEVIKDTGLEVVTQEVDTTNDAAAVQVRIQDDPAVEVNLQDVADTVSDVVAAPVAVVGPVATEGDPTLADVTVLVNPEIEDVKDEADNETVALSESLRSAIRAYKINEAKRAARKRKLTESEDEDPSVMTTPTKDGGAKVVIDEEDDDDEKDKDIPKLSERRSFKKKLKESEDDEAARRELDSEYDALDAEEDELDEEEEDNDKKDLKKMSERAVRRRSGR